MTEVISSQSYTVSGPFDAVLTRNQVLLEDFVASPYNRIVVMGNVVTRRRRPHRQGYLTNYYLNGRRISLAALRVFFAKPLPELTLYQVELNQLCGALRTEVIAEHLPQRDKSDRSWSTEKVIDNDRVTKIVDITNGNKVTFKLNGRAITLAKLKEHFCYGDLYEEIHDFSYHAPKVTQKTEEEPLRFESSDVTFIKGQGKYPMLGEKIFSGFWRVVEYAAPYLVCIGIFVLMGKMYHGV
ncbi:hypothetical protein ST37_13935 [Vibrio sp. qd031]|uniref:hypothetical protein n=1 Tax=Vibrio sp. qd031 TaxID=1603038 RepID=UPI000A117255|nr:hypothetical protein [Vibrio sp. qd031]ORT49493.1 hypothetical protein ST37_13935 [Vibrio sp. qd031]